MVVGMIAVMKSVDVLKNEIEKTRQSLQQTDLTIRRITGRDEQNRAFPNKNNNLENRRSIVSGYSRQEVQGGLKRRYPGVVPGFRSRNPNRESGDDDDDDKVTLTLSSAVIATTKDTKSREEVIQEQSKDKEGNARNRRMFSLLMGTLNQFQEEEKKNERQGRKRKEVEKKLEEKQKEESEKMKKEKQQLFQAKKQQQFKLRQLEVKMEVVQLHEEWEEQSKQLMHFIRTESKPHIYYLPKFHTDITLKKLEQSKQLIEAVVSKRRGMLDEEISNILKAEEENFQVEDDNVHKNEEPMQKKAKLDKENKLRIPGGKVRTACGSHRKLSQDQADQDDSDLEFNRHESIGVDYQTLETMECDKNDFLQDQLDCELLKGEHLVGKNDASKCVQEELSESNEPVENISMDCETKEVEKYDKSD